MDTFENIDNNIPEENSGSIPGEETASEQPRQEEVPASHVYRGIGAGQKESPYADSPYVSGAAPRQDPIHYGYQYQPQPRPVRETKPDKKRRAVWGRVLAAVLVVAIVAGGCLITAASVNSSWEKKNSASMAQMNEKISALEKQIADASRSSGSSVSGTPATTV